MNRKSKIVTAFKKGVAGDGRGKHKDAIPVAAVRVLRVAWQVLRGEHVTAE
jgi:hypothetical protein